MTQTEAPPARDKVQTKASALRDYTRGDPLRVIGLRYGISLPTVSIWAKKKGLKRRQQGCRIKRWPEPLDLKIVAAVKEARAGRSTATFREIGKQVGMTGQGVHRIFHKWKGWRPHAPFQAGARVRFMDTDYQVLVPDIFEGRVKDLATGKLKVIPWRQGSHFAVKL